MTTRHQIVDAAAHFLFGKPLVVNVYRSILVEAMVAAALPDWDWCSADYASYDFRRGDLRLEVKQSALRQTWLGQRLSKPSWDIAPRTGYWTAGSTWVSRPGRNADVYIFALHDTVDETADHREPDQWNFFVVAATNLPPVKRIGLAAVSRLAKPVLYAALAKAIDGQCRK